MSGEQVRIDRPSPKLTLFNTVRKDLPEIAVVNEALLSFVHTELFPWHLRVEIDYRDVADNEMPTPAESERIDEIGDLIEHEVLADKNEFGAPNALFLARSTWNRVREVAYRIHEPESANDTLQALIESREWVRDWSFRMSHDPDWQEAGFWFSLFPLARGEDS